MITENELIRLKQALTSIRAESINDDVWDKFVIPRFFDENELKSQHSLRIEGSRGSGKTMLLKYLSYKSQFSKNRSEISINSLDHIGIYWKADPQFLRTLDKRSISEKDWELVFDSYVVTKVAMEIVNSIFTISESNCEAFSDDELQSFDINGVTDYGFNSSKLKDILQEFESRIIKIEMAITNIKDIENLEKLPSTFLGFLVNKLKYLNDGLKFYIYIDEYENLLSYQQRVINTKIKASDNNIKFNVAIKKNGMSEYRTCSDEKLENIADYRIINLDEKIKENDLEHYLAEILIKKLVDSSNEMKSYIKNVYDFDSSILHNPRKIDDRRKIEYLRKIDFFATQILPQRSSEDLAEEIFSNAKFRDKMANEIDKALKDKDSKLKVNSFISKDYKKATIVCSSLLNRDKLSATEVYSELENLRNNLENKFTGKTEWIKNNFIGTYLRLISTYSQNSTFYSGFDIFCQLSSGNVRHFLELCRTSFGFLSISDLEKGLVISNKLQDIAARQTSETLVREVKQFTPYGTQLSRLVEGLGILFRHYQQSIAQSEPEITQFSFDNKDVLSEDIRMIIQEAEKWGILIIKDSTKEKSNFETGIFEYILNPIYAPRFSISYRKGRKKVFSLAEFTLLKDEGKSGAEKILKNSKGYNNNLQGVLEW